jgi:hypothetical protein
VALVMAPRHSNIDSRRSSSAEVEEPQGTSFDAEELSSGPTLVPCLYTI